MKATVVDQTNTKKGEVELPAQFNEPVREDLIHRAVIAIQANKRQPYGASPRAGLRASADVSKRRRNYRGSYGIGIARTPRKVMSRNGTRMNWVGAVAPNTVGGRRAHPPKAIKQWSRKINDKERKKALRSALAASVDKSIVQKRGHHLPKHYPLIMESGCEKLSKTKDIVTFLEKLGLEDELQRAQVKNIRAGKGKARGRKYKKRKGPLVVISSKDSLRGARNIPGVDVVHVTRLNAELLAPGAVAGRLTVWSTGALDQIKEKKLFT